MPRKKIDTDTLRKRGSRHGNTPARKNEMQAAPLDPNTPPPRWLSDAGRAIWGEHAPAAADEGLLTRVDVVTFGLLCESIAEYQQARDDVAINGLTVPAFNGASQQNPAVKARDSARDAILKIADKCGHTVTSRIGLVLDKLPDKEDTKHEGLKIFAKG